MDTSTITMRTLLERPLDIPILQWCIVILIGAFILLMVYLQTRKDHLDFRWVILDQQRKPSLPKIAQVVALLISSWGFIVQVLKGTLTEEYFLFYMGAWSGAAMFESYISRKTREPRRRDDEADYHAGNPYDDERSPR